MVRLILFLNRVFSRPRVEGRESTQAYSEWEYRWGTDLVRDYLEPRQDLKGKKVLDVGCGLGGKTVAYGEAGASEVFGIDVSIDNAKASKVFAMQHDGSHRWGFFVGDAAALPAPDESFDTVVANDAMEHFARPEAAVREMTRVTRRGGVIWLFFTPHFSPLGSHLYDYIYTPWCHLIFRRRTLERGVREVLRRREPDTGPGELEAGVAKIMDSFDNDLNHMSIRRFFGIVRGVPELQVSFKEFKPAKFGLLKPLTLVPGVRELVTGTVVCRLVRR